jgi:hypothetical protein
MSSDRKRKDVAVDGSDFPVPIVPKATKKSRVVLPAANADADATTVAAPTAANADADAATVAAPTAATAVAAAVVGKKAKAPKQPVVNDIDEMVRKLEGVDRDEVLRKFAPLIPEGVEYEDSTIDTHKQAMTLKPEKDLPDWCFLVLNPSAENRQHKRMSSISVDGKRINTRFLVQKTTVYKTERSFGKPITFAIPEESLEKLAAIIYCCPNEYNGNGQFIP